MTQATALLLAGKRDGSLDPLAETHDVEMKCLVPVMDEPMIVHPLRALAACPQIGTILICTNDPAAILDSVPEAARLQAEGRLRFIDARDHIADSIVAAGNEANMPLLITTADNVLLTPQSLSEFLNEAYRREAAAAAAFAERESVRAAHPEGQRRFYEFKDIAVSTCNLYLVVQRRALRAVDVFRTGGQFVKYPSRIAKAFGVMNLLRFYFGIGTLEKTFANFSRRFGFAIVPVVLSDGALAVDVDNERTYRVATELMRKKRGC